jgi:hypothetical protein
MSTIAARERLLLQLAEMPAFLQPFAALAPALLRARPGCDNAPLIEHLWHLADCDRELYGARIERFRKLAAARSSNGVPAEEVAKAVEHALTSPKPRTRYVVGPDAKRRARVQRLPDRLRDRVLTRFLFGS